MTFEWLDVATDLRFMIPFLLVVIGFGPLLYSIRRTYDAANKKGGSDGKDG